MCVRPGCDRRQHRAQNATKTPKDYVKATVTATKIEDGKQSATITITIAKDWYIYANPVKNDDFKKTQTVVNVKAKKDLANVKIEYPPGKIHEDKIVGNYSVYEEKVVIPVTVQRAAGDVSPLEVEVIFNTCSNKGVCLARIPTRSRCPDPNFRSLQDFGSFSTGARITMPLANLIEDYLAGCEKLRTAVAGMTREQLLARPVPGKWSTLEVVCHLADFEPILATRHENASSRRTGRRWSESTRTSLWPPWRIRIATWRKNWPSSTGRAVKWAALSQAAGVRLAALGVHSERGPRTLEQMLTNAIHHIPHHLKFVQEKRAALGIGQ